MLLIAALQFSAATMTICLPCSPYLSVQEVAGNHAVSLWGRTEAGYATDPIMVERNLIFAATRIQIEMETYPKWCVTHSSLPCKVALLLRAMFLLAFHRFERQQAGKHNCAASAVP